MGAPQYEQAGADVAGSGTPGTIPVWSGSGTTLGDSPLTVSGTTVTATQAFTVNGTHTFNGNLVSGFNQTWTLNGGFLNIQSGLLYLDKTNSRIGIVTASPVASAKLTLGGAANSSIRLSYQTAGTTEVAFDQMNSATGEFRHSSGVSVGWGGFHTFYTDTTEKVRISNTSMDASLVPSYGLKLPATPGATGAGTEQILDCYAEGTWTPTLAGFGGTTPTVNTARYVRIGSVVHCTVVLTASPNFSSTYGTTTLTAPFSATYNAAVPTNVGAAGISSGQQNAGGTTVYLPTFGTITASTISWTFLV